MNTGQFYLPTKIIWSRDAVRQNAAIFKQFGNTALIVTGKYSAKTNGALDDVLATLKDNNQNAVVFDRVMSNPTIDCIYEGADFARKNQVEFIIAIGGGSPLDASKAINFLMNHNIERQSLFTTPPTKPLLPLIAIPTTAGTGSEVTQYSVLMNDALKTKSSLSYPELFPTIALLDGRYMMNLPPRITTNTALDALSHLIESSLSLRATEITRKLSEKGLSLLKPYLKRLNMNDLTEKDRNTLLTASTIGGIVIAQTSTTAVHTMGYPLTYFKNIEHGRANACLLPAYLSWLEKHAPQQTRSILDVLDISGVTELNSIFAELLGERKGLTDNEIAQFTAISITNTKIHSGIVDLTESDVRNIYRASFV